MLPVEVLEEAKENMLSLGGTGIGIMEHSHRGKAFIAVLAQAEADCRKLAGIPDDYRVLFLQGGASTQFFQIPMNFLSSGDVADYLVTLPYVDEDRIGTLPYMIAAAPVQTGSDGGILTVPLANQQREIERLEATLAEHTERLSAALAASGAAQGSAAVSLSQLLRAAEALVHRIEADDRQRQQLAREREQLERDVAASAKQVEASTQALAAWASEWADATRVLRLRQGAEPAEASARAA